MPVSGLPGSTRVYDGLLGSLAPSRRLLWGIDYFQAPKEHHVCRFSVIATSGFTLRTYTNNGCGTLKARTPQKTQEMRNPEVLPFPVF